MGFLNACSRKCIPLGELLYTTLRALLLAVYCFAMLHNKNVIIYGLFKTLQEHPKEHDSAEVNSIKFLAEIFREKFLLVKLRTRVENKQASLIMI